MSGEPPLPPAYDPNEVFRQDREDQRLRAKLREENIRALAARNAEKGQAALKAALIINGGAAVAVLTFMGHAVDKAAKTGTLLPGLALALFFFVMGVLAAAVASGATFLFGLSAGYELWKDLTTPPLAPPSGDSGTKDDTGKGKEKENDAGKKNDDRKKSPRRLPPQSELWNWLAVLLVSAAYVAFAFGCFQACRTLLAFKG